MSAPFDRRSGKPVRGSGGEPQPAHRSWNPPPKRFPWGKIFVFLILCAAAWAAWKYLSPYVKDADERKAVEGLGVSITQRMNGVDLREDEFVRALADETTLRLQAPAAKRAAWCVVWGPRGKEPKIVRDDGFSKSERAFVERFVDEGRGKADFVGLNHGPFTWPLGLAYSTARSDGDSVCIVVGWRFRD